MTGKPTLKVFFFGDSICFGQLVSPHKIWVAEISRRLDAELGHLADIVVQNPSISGNTTRMALERMPFDVQAHAPDVLIVQFGMNDCNVWMTDNGHPRTSPRGFTANLTEIIDRGRRFGAREVILGANHPTTRTKDHMPGVHFTYDANNRAYGKLIREVAAETGALLVDMEKAFDDAVAAGRHTYAELVLADQLHLSEAGHRIYVEGYADVVVAAARRALEAKTGLS